MRCRIQVGSGVPAPNGVDYVADDTYVDWVDPSALGIEGIMLKSNFSMYFEAIPTSDNPLDSSSTDITTATTVKRSRKQVSSESAENSGEARGARVWGAHDGALSPDGCWEMRGGGFNVSPAIKCLYKKTFKLN